MQQSNLMASEHNTHISTTNDPTALHTIKAMHCTHTTHANLPNQLPHIIAPTLPPCHSTYPNPDITLINDISNEMPLVSLPNNHLTREYQPHLIHYANKHTCMNVWIQIHSLLQTPAPCTLQSQHTLTLTIFVQQLYIPSLVKLSHNING